MKTRNILQTIVIAAAVLIVSTAAAPADKQSKREKFHKQAEQFKKTEIIPAMRQWKAKLDGAIEPADLAALNKLRSRAAEVRTQIKSDREAFLEKKKSGAEIDYNPLILKSKKYKDTLRSIAEAVMPLAKKYKSTLEEIGNLAKPKVEEWKTKFKEKFPDMKPRKAGDEGFGGGKGHRGGLSGMMEGFGAGGRKGMAVKFMLWDGSDDINPRDARPDYFLFNENFRPDMPPAEDGDFMPGEPPDNHNDFNYNAKPPSGQEGGSFVSKKTSEFIDISDEPVVYPNPSGGDATINFLLNDKQYITINIIDFSGRTIGNIYSGNLDKGQNSITFAPSKNDFSLTSGSYLFNIQGEYYNYTGKIILMK